jgi:hypothetical protein
MFSADDGIQIDCSEHEANAVSPRVATLEAVSNVTIEGAPQKQDFEMIWTEEGRQIDFSDEQ